MTNESFQELLSDQQASGHGQKRYCKEHGVSYSTFQYWLRKTKTLASPDASGFVKLTVPPPVSEAIEMRLPGCITIALRPGFDPALLRAVVDALRS